MILLPTLKYLNLVDHPKLSFFNFKSLIMKSNFLLYFLLSIGLLAMSCVSKKKFMALETDLNAANADLGKYGESLNKYMQDLANCQKKLEGSNASLDLRQEQITDLRAQISDLISQRDAQLNQVGDLTVLSKSANENIKETLAQLEKKDKYIQLLQAAKSKTDSINLALAVNLKGQLADGLMDEDIEVTVDKTVVMVNLSDKMLFESGSSKITSRADEVLGKIAQIIESRPDFEVMVEGHTDNVPIKNNCTEDNWDLSVKRATSVVRSLQESHGIDPARLIAAGRGEFNALTSNETDEGKAINRRTRIIIMPKLDQFYDLLAPGAMPN